MQQLYIPHCTGRHRDRSSKVGQRLLNCSHTNLICCQLGLEFIECLSLFPIQMLTLSFSPNRKRSIVSKPIMLLFFLHHSASSSSQRKRAIRCQSLLRNPQCRLDIFRVEASFTPAINGALSISSESESRKQESDGPDFFRRFPAALFSVLRIDSR
jgi:hypothetical protein